MSNETIILNGVCSIQPLDGWSAELGEEDNSPFIKITPITNDSVLRLTNSDLSPAELTANEWIEFASKINRKKGRKVTDVQVTDFKGTYHEFQGMDMWIRGWTLEHNGIPMDICYRCKLDLKGRDDEDVSDMLETLRKI